MESSIEPRALMSHVLPGFFALIVLLYFYLNENTSLLDFLRQPDLGKDTLIGVSSFLASWILGHLFDAIRNILEELKWRICPNKDKLIWNFFLSANEEKMAQFQ